MEENLYPCKECPPKKKKIIDSVARSRLEGRYTNLRVILTIYQQDTTIFELELFESIKSKRRYKLRMPGQKIRYYGLKNR